MPDVVVEPGTRLVERYRLEECLGGSDMTYWLARDELLDRSVGICLLPAHLPTASAVLQAARRAAALTDARFLRVLDAAEQDGVVYVVSEWVPSRTLEDLVADEPLSPPEARDLALEVAAALATAHQAGLYHLALRPQHVRRTAHGQVKLAGLAVAAAAESRPAPDAATAERQDTAGVGALLYTALTGRWPGEDPTELPSAPREGDAPCSPRQVRAGVPDVLDDIVARAMSLPVRHGSLPLVTTTELRDALQGLTLAPRSRPPLAAIGDATGRDDVSDRPAADAPRRAGVATFAWGLTALVLVVGLVLAGTQLALNALDGDRPQSGPSAGSEAPDGEDSVGPLRIAAVTVFDPPPGNGEEHDDEAPLAIDGDDDTAWLTVEYYDPLNLLKEGVGLIVDIGEPQSISEVRVGLPGGGTDVEIRVADELGSRVQDFRKVASERRVDGQAVLQLDDVSGRYVLVWLTGLPAIRESTYQGRISEISVSG